jgi:hypothetical protein
VGGAFSGPWPLAASPFLLQAVLMLVDEGFHLRRGLPAWERWGHPLDTFLTAACYLLALRAPAGGTAVYAGVCAAACLFVTKDEWAHARHCSGGESWLHACLFLLHPVILALAGLWAFGPPSAFGPRGHAAFGTFLAVQTGLTAAFGIWQIAYWNGPWGRARPASRAAFRAVGKAAAGRATVPAAAAIGAAGGGLPAGHAGPGRNGQDTGNVPVTSGPAGAPREGA